MVRTELGHDTFISCLSSIFHSRRTIPYVTQSCTEGVVCFDNHLAMTLILHVHDLLRGDNQSWLDYRCIGHLHQGASNQNRHSLPSGMR